MSYLAKDSALVDHALDTELVSGEGSVEMFTHGIKTTSKGGAHPYRNLDVQPGGVNVNTAPTQLYGSQIWNDHATAVRWLKVYDVAYAPTVSDVPAKTIGLKAQENTSLDALVGIEFKHGIGLRATTGKADSDTGAPSAGDVIVNLDCSAVGGFLTSIVGTCAAAGAVGPVVTG